MQYLILYEIAPLKMSVAPKGLAKETNWQFCRTPKKTTVDMSEHREEPNEKSAMISRLSTAYNHGAVDVMGDDSVPRRGWIQSKFTQMYLMLCVVSLLCIGTFTIVLILTLRMSEMGNKYDEVAKNAKTGLNSITNLFSYPKNAPDDSRPPLPDQQLNYQNHHPRAGAAKIMSEIEGDDDQGMEDPAPRRAPVDAIETTRRPMAATYPPAPPVGATPPTPVTAAPPAQIQLPPGLDPAIFRPENLPNLLQLASHLHIDLTKLPKEYQERVIQKAPARVVPDSDEYVDESSTRIDDTVVGAEEGEDQTVVIVTTTTTTTTHAPLARKAEVIEEVTKPSSIDLSSNATTSPDTRQFHSKKETTRKEGGWRDASCSTLGKCMKEDYAQKPLLLISIDGFAQDFLKLRLTPSLDRIADCGATAEFVYPSYPSKTFPNHFTIVTGMWPANHGIIDNNIFDPSISPHMESMKKNSANHSKYFKAEPIWSAYKRSTGKKTACLFWVGCQQNLTDYDPDYNLPYEKKMSFEERVDKMVEWLSSPVDSRPGLITAYFPQLDTAAHWEKKPGQVEEALKSVDEAMSSLFDRLEALDILECVNIVIVSDHGMQKLTNRVYLEDHFSTEGLGVAEGVVGRVYWNGSKSDPADVMKDFRCSGGEEYRVYSPSSLPPRCHYASSRAVGDVIFEGQLGTTFYKRAAVDPMLTADHGYDYILSPMRAIFYARGPSIKQKVMLPPFQNIEYYHFFEDLLGMKEDHPTNGTRGMLDAALNDSPSRVTEEPKLLAECPRIRQTATALPCRRCTNAERRSLDTLFASLGDVTTLNPQLAIDPSSESSSEFCLSPFHDIVLVSPRHSKNGTRVFVESLSLTGVRTYPDISGNCSFENGRFEDTCSSERAPTGFQMTSLLAGNASGFSGLAKAEIPLHISFVKDFLDPLQALTSEYLTRYGRLLSFTGTIFDYNTDGRADESASSTIPSHIFRVLLSCRHWQSDSSCTDPSESAIIGWMIPHIEEDFNCLAKDKLLLSYTARLRDIELATGLKFFADRRIVSDNVAKHMSTFISDRLW